jgi:hypothetical protein
MTAADRFVVSGLDYMTWANKMVAEGKMYWPNKTSTIEIQACQASFSFTNLACGYIGADISSYEDGVAYLCSLITQYVGFSLTGAQYILQDGICGDSLPCSFILDVAFGISGSFDAVPSICIPIFEKIYSSCNGVVGGAAQMSVKDSEGTHTGIVGAQFFAFDEGVVCPANTDTNVCGSSRIN